MPDPTSTITLSDRIKTARKFAGITQKVLADRVGITQTAIFKIESGGSRSSRKAVNIALACGVDPIWLDTGRGEMSLGGPPGEGYRTPVIARIPLITWDEAKAYTPETSVPQNVKAWIPVAPRTSSKAYALEVPDDSMDRNLRKASLRKALFGFRGLGWPEMNEPVVFIDFFLMYRLARDPRKKLFNFKLLRTISDNLKRKSPRNPY